MVEAPISTHQDIVAHLKSVFDGAASTTERTDDQVRFGLRAADLPPLIEWLCNVDFPKAAPGFASWTVIEHIGCYLIRSRAVETTLHAPRTSARSLLHALTVGAASVA